ncbi:MAG TPA: hypothetical protein VLA19_09745 [Herpetosiphonaceae bacterium]|nr:hypothetical protein [Herpetosiphonaceae bacterium]
MFDRPVPRSHDLAALLATLPSGQRRVAEALVADPRGRTYPAVAAALGVHVGTVHRHLARIRRLHSEAYAALMVMRREQLAERHWRALNRARVRRWARQYRHRHLYGYELWERRSAP